MRYRTQYVALGCIFVVMLVWNLLTAHSVSQATAELVQETVAQAEAESVAREFADTKSEIADLMKKAKTITRCDSRIDVASVLGELSFLIDSKIVLSKVGLSAERFADDGEGKRGRGSAVRVVGGARRPPGASMGGNVRFKVVLSGVASDAGDVAALICKLEDSPYFCQVIPSFSRNRQIKSGPSLAKESVDISEFEMSCYLANYRQEEGRVAPGVPNSPAKR
ncbi:MAG: hypothetical protein ACYS4W_01655 [Planctomycetota bacterium]